MARKIETIITLIDDLDGSEAVETVPFSYLGANYEIDLSEKNSRRFADLLKPYLDAARSTASGRGTARTPRSHKVGGQQSRDQLRSMRAWARESGWPNLSERGRVPQEVQAAYNACH